MKSAYIICSARKIDRLEVPSWGWTDYYIKPSIADMVGSEPELTSVRYIVRNSSSTRTPLLRSGSSSQNRAEAETSTSKTAELVWSSSADISTDHNPMIRVQSVQDMNIKTVDKRVCISAVYVKTVKRKFHRTVKYVEAQIIQTAIPITEPVIETLDKPSYSNYAYIAVGRGNFPRIVGISQLELSILFQQYGVGILYAGNQYVTHDAIYRCVIDDVEPQFAKNIKIMPLDPRDKCTSMLKCNLCYNCNKKIKDGKMLDCKHMVTCNKCYAKRKACAKCNP